MALAHADAISSIQGDLSKKEQPPDWMWGVPWKLNEHLERVAEWRKDPKKHEQETEMEDEEKYDRFEIPEGWR